MIQAFGIGCTLLLLIALAIAVYKGVPILVASPICGALCLLCNGMPVMEGMKEAYIGEAAGFFKTWFLFFLAGAILGKIMERSGAAASIARFIIDKCGTGMAIPGFILNRITLAVFREVTYIAGMGYASPEDIDTAIVSTFGPRYAFEGPFGLVDFAGSELYKRLAELLFPEISDAKVPPQLIQDMIDSGKLGVRSGEGFYHYDHPETAGGKREVKITRMIQAINKVNEELGGYND